MFVIFLGPPGSGKGTQAKILSSLLSLKHVSTGDMLREVACSGSRLGVELASVMANGDLVTDDTVNEIVAEYLGREEYKQGFILDGYPRTLAQAEFLEKKDLGNYLVLYLKISTEKLESRILGRYVCLDCGEIYNSTIPLEKEGMCNKCGGTSFVNRADDNAESLLTRVKIFEKEASSLLEFYKRKGKLAVVDADESIETVTKQIIESIKNN